MGAVSLRSRFTCRRAMGGGVVVMRSAEVVIQVRNDARNLERAFCAIPTGVIIRQWDIKELKWS